MNIPPQLNSYAYTLQVAAKLDLMTNYHSDVFSSPWLRNISANSGPLVTKW